MGTAAFLTWMLFLICKAVRTVAYKATISTPIKHSEAIQQGFRFGFEQKCSALLIQKSRA